MSGIAVNVPQSMMQRAEKLTDYLRTVADLSAMSKLSRADIIRLCISRGLVSLENDKQIAARGDTPPKQAAYVPVATAQEAMPVQARHPGIVSVVPGAPMPRKGLQFPSAQLTKAQELQLERDADARVKALDG